MNSTAIFDWVPLGSYQICLNVVCSRTHGTHGCCHRFGDRLVALGACFRPAFWVGGLPMGMFIKPTHVLYMVGGLHGLMSPIHGANG